MTSTLLKDREQSPTERLIPSLLLCASLSFGRTGMGLRQWQKFAQTSPSGIHSNEGGFVNKYVGRIHGSNCDGNTYSTVRNLENKTKCIRKKQFVGLPPPKVSILILCWRALASLFLCHEYAVASLIRQNFIIFC